MFNKISSSNSPFSALDRKTKDNKSKQTTLNSFFSSSSKKFDNKGLNRTKSESNAKDVNKDKEHSRFFSQSFSSQLTTKVRSSSSFENNKRDIVEILDGDDDSLQEVKKPKNFKTTGGPKSTSFASTILTQTTSSILLSSSNSPTRKTTMDLLKEQKNYQQPPPPTFNNQIKERSNVTSGKPISSILSMKSTVVPTAVKPSRKRQPPWAVNLMSSQKPNQKLKPPGSNSSQSSSNSFKSKSDIIEGMVLSEEQEKVLDLAVNQRKNIFYTGSAGTGKSLLLKVIIQNLIRLHGAQNVAVTASTGLAATNIDGMTLNRFAGFGLGTGAAIGLIHMIKKSKMSMDRWKRTKVLIIDEVSMVNSEMFTKLNMIAKAIRSSNRPFGGIQLIITGDFFQLPPIDKNSNGSMDKTNFCFKSEAWNEVIDHTILLTQVFRQKGDSTLINMLNALRIGDVDDKMFKEMKKLERKLIYDDGILPTELFATRNEVFRANTSRLNSLVGKNMIYRAGDMAPDEKLKGQLESLMAVNRLDLKIGAQVMMLKNQEDYIVNGTIGKVIGFLSQAQYSEFVNSFQEHELFDMDDFFEITSTHLTGFVDQAHQSLIDSKTAYIMKNRSPEKVNFLIRMIERAKIEGLSVQQNSDYLVPESPKTALDMKTKSDILPVIKFSISGDSKFAIRQISQESFSLEKREDVSRTQLPLLLSWALSIHKSQGQTLPRVKVDLSRIFEIGQLYVALSRATSADSLEIVNLRRENIKVSENVKQFYSKLKIFQD